MKTIIWERERISGGNDSIVTRAAKKMIQNEALITKWAPALLKMQLDSVLWKDADHISVKTLWDDLCTYCYLPRLASYSVLEETIKTGLNSPEYFAASDGFSDGRYMELRYNCFVGSINLHSLLVKVQKAKEQLEKDVRERVATSPIPSPYENQSPKTSSFISSEESVTPQESDTASIQLPVHEAENKSFYMTASLDTTRINRDVNKLVEEIISHLTEVDGNQVSISLEVHASFKNGADAQTVRTVTENCRTLKVDNYGFEN